MVKVGVRPELPIQDIDMLLGNDLAGNQVVVNPVVCDKPLRKTHDNDEDIFPACAVTRAMMKAKVQKQESEESKTPLETKNEGLGGLDGTFLQNMFEQNEQIERHVSETEQSHDSKTLSEEQENDPSLAEVREQILPQVEADKVPVCFYRMKGVIMRKWRPPDVPPDEDWNIINQIVVPERLRKDILRIAHSHPVAGNLGMRKTHDKVLQYFWWPKLRYDIQQFCKSCHECQVVGKPNQKIPAASLIYIKANTGF
jgi:hypothetical protein